MECRDAPAERPRPAPGQALSRSLVALDQNSTIIAVIEMSQLSWLVAGMLPGIEHQPCKKLEPSRLLAGALACGAWRRGSRDPCLEPRGIAGASPSENRPARHRVAEARVPGVAAWRTEPLQHGARAHDCRRGRQAAEPRARLPGGGTRVGELESWDDVKLLSVTVDRLRKWW